MKKGTLAEAFGAELEAEADEELDETAPEAGEDSSDEAIEADADLFFDSNEDKATRLEALRRLVKRLR